jgi:hypothetical protein
MRRLGSLTLLLLGLVFLNLHAQEPTPESQDHLQVDSEHQKWIEHVMRSISSVKAGMTRKDLAKIFQPDGGLSTRSQTRYLYRRCPYIKVDVEFSPAGEPGDASQEEHYESPDDRIVKISRPYLDNPVAD